ncbi:MAG: DUF885 domain-containing protein [Myxococcota bacterium]
MRGSSRCCLALAAALACSCQPAPTTTPTGGSASGTEEEPEDPNQAFRDLAHAWLDASHARHPSRAVELGLHEYDGKLRDVSEAGLNNEKEALEEALAQFSAIDPAPLDAVAKVERGVVLQAIRSDLFDLVRRRQPWTNPMAYLDGLNLAPYISREYAPLAQRAKAIVTLANSTPEYLEHAKGRLEEALPRTFIDTALLQVRGTVAFISDDVPAATKGLPKELASDLDAALAAMAAALQDYDAFLVKRRAKATDDYALGADLFAEMLRETQGFDVSLERLEEIGRLDLNRNLVAMTAAAAKLDKKRPVAKVVAKAVKDKPPADGVLAEATEQATDMRKFLLDNKLVTIPSPDVAEVRPSPPFMRWNAAFLSSAGAFEATPLPSFYYISPPDPSWPKKQQQAYIPAKADLLFITIHEVWPGHFLHGLHLKANSSRILKSAWNYAMGEGWAHYAEEMMWEAGISDDPAVHIGQLQNALLRNIRYMSAIGLHTGGMTVEASVTKFRDQAFQDEANARQQAVRGTFDPMYLSYTLGKLAIMKLRTDVEAKWKAEDKPFTLLAFHDALLSYGAAPLPVIREAMLGPDAGPIL